MKLVFLFTFQYAVYTCLAAVMNSITSPYGYTPTDASIVGASFVVSGVFGSIFFSFILDYFQCYLLTMRIVLFATIVIGVPIYFTLPHGSTVLFSINIGLLGFFLLPIIMISFSFCSETTYPISEALSQGIIVLFSQIYGTALSYFSTWIIE